MGTRRQSNLMGRILRLLAGLLVLSAPLLAQAPRVSARLSAGVLRLGDTASLAITVENTDKARIVAIPEVPGVAFGSPGRPSSRSYTSIVNGRVSSQVTMTWQLSVRPETVGDYQIPPIVIEAAGQRFSTQAISLTVVADLEGEELGYLEIRPSTTRVIEGQPFSVEVFFGWDSSMEVNYADLNLPWWDALPGAIQLEIPVLKDGIPGFIVNREFEVTAQQLETRERRGKPQHTLRLVRTYLPTRSGTLEFPTSFFEFGYRQRTSLFDTRPARRTSHFVQAAAFALEVIALPTKGQPLDFSGAVGRLEVRASADSRDVRVGDSIKLTVQWSGSGNLQFFAPPDPGTQDAFRGFRVYGSTEEKAVDRRTVVYDLAPLSTEVSEIPALRLSVFDPEAEAYTTIATEPIPIRVRPLERTSDLEVVSKAFERGIADIDTRRLSGQTPGEASGQDAFLLTALVLVPLLGLALRSGVRRRAGDPSAPLERRRRRARRALSTALARAPGPAAQREAFLEYLAARTRESAPAWDGRDLGLSAATARLPEVHRRGTSALLARLDAAVWGGAPAVPADELLAAARQLEGEGL